MHMQYAHCDYTMYIVHCADAYAPYRMPIARATHNVHISTIHMHLVKIYPLSICTL